MTTPARPLRSITPGVERVAAGDRPRHYHREGYANIVLSGRFAEAAFAGRSDVEPGHVLLHGAFDAHADTGLTRGGVTILRLPWPGAAREGRFAIPDPDAIARLAERDVGEAVLVLNSVLTPCRDARSHWTDRLATELVGAPPVRLGLWAEENGLSPETLSRGFRRAFGVSPKRFQAEARTRAAWLRIVGGDADLTTIAHGAGFADLAHMTRSVAALTGASPSRWRRDREARRAALARREPPARLA